MRHNGGSVWLDDLGQPWPKHGCFLDQPKSSSIDWAIDRSNEAAERLHIGLVVKTMRFRIPGFEQSLLALSLSNGTGLCVRLPDQAGVVLGDVMLVSPRKHDAILEGLRSGKIKAVRIEPSAIDLKPTFLKTGHLKGMKQIPQIQGSEDGRLQSPTSEYTDCPKCGCRLRTKNLAKHYDKVHPRSRN